MGIYLGVRGGRRAETFFFQNRRFLWGGEEKEEEEEEEDGNACFSYRTGRRFLGVSLQQCILCC
jgi:hypothetical protein